MYSLYINDLTTIKKLGGNYKVVTMKIPIKRPGFESCLVSARGTKYDTKLSNNLSRARTTVREYALCNDFEWFGTFTLDKLKYDRYDLGKFIKDFGQYIRNYRRLKGANVEYILIPEQHKDGAWHMHGLLKGISVNDLISFDGIADVPEKLKNKDYYNWVGYQKRFGFNSLGVIRDKEKCANYIVKYINKDLGTNIELNCKSYYCSKGLKKPQLIKKGTLASTLDYDFENDYCKVLTTPNIDNIIINAI